MLYKAKISFCGVVNMAEGEIGEISDSSIAKELISVGYIEEYSEEPKKKPRKKRSTKK